MAVIHETEFAHLPKPNLRLAIGGQMLLHPTHAWRMAMALSRTYSVMGQAWECNVDSDPEMPTFENFS